MTAISRRHAMLTASAAIATSGLPFGYRAAFGQALSYPDKLVKLIVPSPAGGNFDIIARTYASPSGEALGQSIIVENRVGAAGTIGTTAAARSASDGYTLCDR